MIDLEPAAGQVRTILHGIVDSQLDGPTPCPDYDVRGLVAHVIGLCEAFTAAADKRIGASTSAAPDPAAVMLPDGWRDLIDPRLDALVNAWRSPAAWQGETQAGGVALPGAVAGQVVVNELVVHGWDLARATGQPFEADEASTQVVLEIGMGTSAEERDGTFFGPVVPVPAHAAVLERAIGLAGRDPQWTPAA